MKQMNVLLQVGDLVVVDPASVNGGADLCPSALVVHLCPSALVGHDRIIVLSSNRGTVSVCEGRLKV